MLPATRFPLFLIFPGDFLTSGLEAILLDFPAMAKFREHTIVLRNMDSSWEFF